MVLIAGAMASCDNKGTERQKKPVSFALKDVSGSEVSFESFRGKVVLLDFWATTCPSCVASIPELIELQGRLRPKGFEVVAISMDYSAADVKYMMEQKGINYTVLMSDERVEKMFGVVSIPTSFLINKSGVVEKRHMGFAEGVVLGMESDIRLLLEGMPLKINKEKQEN